MIINLVNFSHAALAFMIAFSAFFTAPLVLEKKVAQFFYVNERRVALTFNAAFGADDTDILLEILRKNDVFATFFFCETWVDRYPEDLQKFAAAGHEIANHGNTHDHVARFSLGQKAGGILECRDKIKALTGIETTLYRPAYGECDNNVISEAEALNHLMVLWDVDSMDWLGRGIDIENILNSVKNDSIIMFHNGAEFTPRALDAIIKGLKEKGYEIVPVSRLIENSQDKITAKC